MPSNRFVNAFFTTFVVLLTHTFASQAQVADWRNPQIKTIRLHPQGNQLGLALYRLNSEEQLELHFDDLENNYKNYYYTFQLCDINWKPVNMSPFNYLKGFTQQRITTYRFSSIAFTRYTHYQANLPERGMKPMVSGNYLLKVFENGDTSKLAFSTKMLVVDTKANISPQIIQPYNALTNRTHQKLIFNATLLGINPYNAMQEVKVVILQNNRWDNAQTNIAPTFVRGNALEYNSENSCIFPAGKEWRWLDLRSLRFQSERIAKANYNKNSTEIFAKEDADRSAQRYQYYLDYNSQYTVETYERINPLWQGDYATVYFSFVPPNKQAYSNKDVYITGQLANYAYNENAKMTFNAEKGIYEKSLFLKQGFYSYGYALANKNQPLQPEDFDGNYWETENTYTILMYYKAFADRADQLIGLAQVKSRLDRPQPINF